MIGEYKISNPHPNGKFNSDFSKRGAEYFDVYSPEIKSTYGEVTWKMLDKVLIPDNIIKKFRGKTMAVVGWEMD